MRLLSINVDDESSDVLFIVQARTVGPVELFLKRGRFDSTLLGLGPLHTSGLPGSHRLVICGMSGLTLSPYISTLGSVGQGLSGLDLDAVELTGKARVLSMIYISKNGHKVMPLDSKWFRHVRGTRGLLEKALSRAEHEGAWALAVGSGARVSAFGSVAGRSFYNDSISWAGRGGLGTRLLKEHNIAAILLDAPGSAVKAVPMRPGGKDFLFDPRLSAKGTLVANLEGLGDRALCINAMSAKFSRKERSRIFEDLLKPGMLRDENEKGGMSRGRSCGEVCQIACRREIGGARVDFQPFSSLGPNIGVFGRDHVLSLITACDYHGFDAVELGGLIAWELERTSVLNDSASFEEIRDRQEECYKTALSLISDIGSGKRMDLAAGLAAAASDSRDRDKALFLSNARGGGIAPLQYWSPGVLAPVAPQGRYHTYFGTDFIPPFELGRLCSERSAIELALDDLGLCRFQQEWAEEQLEELGLLYGKEDENIFKLHARMSKELIERTSPLPWATARAAEMIKGHLESWKDEERGFEGEDLSKWTDLFEKDPMSASISYWQELKKGMEETMII
ncbi:MAG: hypothetical protein GXP49_18285 [Deltaproteobacteria bacterium]|nr:hypothetical protein [Deltaproteobacteria bacterium]